MVKLHVGYDGTPMNCIAQEGNCPLAPNMGHFTKPEQAQAFADKLNELRAEGYSYHGMVAEDVNKLSNAELVYIQKDILNKAEENDNYSDYKGQIKWQKEVRSKAQRDMKAIIEQDNEVLGNLAGHIDNVAALRSKWRTSEPENRKEAYSQYRAALTVMNHEYKKAAAITVQNQADFGKLVDKKDIATAKFMPMMERRAQHAGIKQLKANIDAEITERDGGAESSGKDIQADKVKEKSDVREINLGGYTKESLNEEISYHLDTDFGGYNEDEYNGSSGSFTEDSIDEINDYGDGNTDFTKQLKSEFQKNPNSVIQPESTLKEAIRYNAYEHGYGKEYYNEILKDNNDKEEKKIIKSLKKELDPSFKIKGQNFYQLDGGDLKSKINNVLIDHFRPAE